MKPRYVFLDTNNWIYLANGFNPYSKKHEDVHLKVFDLFARRAEEGSIIVLVNQIVLDEFERNKAQTEAKIHDIQNKVKAYVGNLKPVKEFLGDSNAELEAIEKKIVDSADLRIADLRRHNFNVERFLKKWTIQIPITDKQKLKAAEMAVEKKAPFIGEKRNSMADALHILSFAEYVELNSELAGRGRNQQIPPGYFVTSNSGDFSDPDNKETLHADLVPILDQSGSKFYYVLHKLVNDLEQEFLSKEEQRIIEEADSWAFCEICDYEFEDLDYSMPFELFDPHLLKGGSRDENQLGLFKEIIVRPEHPYVLTRTVNCNNCGSEYLECPNCLELMMISEEKNVVECSECYYQYRFTDDKIEGIEIIMSQQCSSCGIEFQELNEVGFCETCAEYEKIANEE